MPYQEKDNNPSRSEMRDFKLRTPVHVGLARRIAYENAAMLEEMTGHRVAVEEVATPKGPQFRFKKGEMPDLDHTIMRITDYKNKAK